MRRNQSYLRLCLACLGWFRALVLSCWLIPPQLHNILFPRQTKLYSHKSSHSDGLMLNYDVFDLSILAKRTQANGVGFVDPIRLSIGVFQYKIIIFKRRIICLIHTFHTGAIVEIISLY